MSKRAEPGDITSEQPESTQIIVWNTLHKKKEVFSPNTPGHMSMYNCGPTVYNFAHVGNLRAYVVADIFRRVFEFNEYTVTQITNITDIGHLQSDQDDGEDKMTLALKREGKPLNLESMREVANTYYDAFRADLGRINVLPAHLFPFASEHVDDDISFIQSLMQKDHAYVTSDGIYFDTNSIPDYGILGGVAELDETTLESRLNSQQASNEKRDRRDFALWKFNEALGFEAKFGKGFPGWHIECSAMSMKYLGENFDIHTGGIDHIPVHHNNEIAQSEALSGKLLANYWLHNAHVIMEGGKKMAKSGEQFVTLDTLAQHGISPLGFRYWLLGASYRTPIQFSFDALKQSQQAYMNLIEKIASLLHIDEAGIESGNGSDIGMKEDIDQHTYHLTHNIQKIKKIINNDFDTAQALAEIQVMLKNTELDASTKIAIIEQVDAVFGLELIASAKRVSAEYKDRTDISQIPEHIQGYADARWQAKQNKDWDEADRLRNLIQEAGYDIVDEQNDYKLIKS